MFPLLGFAVASLLSTPATLAQVRRAEVIATAQSYLTLKWKPSRANAFHGLDSNGVQVDTPDISFSRPGIRPGWWIPGRQNTGMPYMWGGFSNPEEFRAGLKRGRYAGDVYTAEKRRQGNDAVSKEAVGIDCSGLISRCWKLERAYDTKELASLCTVLASFDDLKAGDILNVANDHVLLFREINLADRSRILAYEAGSPPSWKVLLNDIPTSMLKERGYVPLRYRKIRD